MKKEEALSIIAAKVAQVQALLGECETIADEADVSFKFYPVDGADYGLCRDPGYKFNDYVEQAYWRPIDDEGWVPSSLDC